MSSLLTVKAYLKEGDVECRRFKVNDEQTGNIDKLKEKLKQVFPKLQDKTFTITQYTDKEGDDVIISSDEELADAVEEVKRKQEDLFKITIKQHTEDKEKATGPSCNSCKKDLSGIHFQCLQCPNHWLCQSCEKKGEHYHHSMMRLSQPLPTQEQIKEQFTPWISMWKNMMGCSDNDGKKQNNCKSQRRENTSSCGNPESCEGTPQTFNLSDFINQLMEGCGPTEQGATGGSDIVCDDCKTALNKTNFKCLQCENYHLCVDCESKGVHQDHNMIRFPCPMPSQETMMKHLHPWLSMLFNMGKQNKCGGSGCHKERDHYTQATYPMFAHVSQFFPAECRYDARRLLPQEVLDQVLRAGTTAAEMFTAMGAGYHH